MFGLGSKQLEIGTPVAGKIIDITEVPDKTFANKLIGDGFAVEPENDAIIKAPISGKVILLAETLHAIVIESHKAQLLIHIGLDTVELEGNGFAAKVQLGDMVEKGEPLIGLDVGYIRQQGKQLTTMVILANTDKKIKLMSKSLENPQCAMLISVKA